MNDKEEAKPGIEFDVKSLSNLLIKLALLAGWTGLVFLAADKLNFLGDGLAATDFLVLAAELGGAQIIAQSDNLLK